ncbi:MAG: hypothetical protein HFF64_10970 [Oscillospiraceae bacterium]|nr:hypothetical protein [Oscillospiraceae bacterium]
MTERDICCAICPRMTILYRANLNRNNDHLHRPRGSCFCKHPEAEAAFHLVCPRSGSTPGFIAFTKRDSDKPDLKTAPRWCPRKLTAAPREVSKKTGDQIIRTRHPLGLFWLLDNGIYVGIDNHDGNAWTEDFDTKCSCLEWLNGESHPKA